MNWGQLEEMKYVTIQISVCIFKFINVMLFNISCTFKLRGDLQLCKPTDVDANTDLKLGDIKMKKNGKCQMISPDLQQESGQ